MLKHYLLVIGICLFLIPESFGQTWNQKANVPAIGRHRCISFSIGNKGYVGLGHINSVSNILYEDFWEYNPASNTWTQKANFGGGLRYHAHSFAIGNKAYVGTGRNNFGGYEDDNWEYSPATNTWTEVQSFPGTPRRGAISFVINGLGYVGTGQVNIGGSNNFYSYDPVLDSWASVATFPGLERTSSVGFAIGTKGYLGTGELMGALTGATNDFWEYDPSLDLWTQKTNVSDSIRQEATGFSLGAFGYIGCGKNPTINDDTDDFYEYHPATDTWVEIEDFLGISRRYMVAFVISGKAYTAVGTNGTNFNDLWEYNPTYPVAFNIPTPPDVALDEKSNGDFDFDFDSLPSTSGELKLLIYNKDGKVIDEIPVTNKSFTVTSESYPAHCIYKLMSENKVYKAGKLKQTK